MSNVPSFFLELAYQDGAHFTNSKKGDVIFRSGNASQNILIGPTSNNEPTTSMIGFTSNAVVVDGTFIVNGGQGASLDVNDAAAVINSNLIIGANLGIRTIEPSEYLDVNQGSAKIGSNLYVINKASISTTSSNPSEALDVGSNAKIMGNLYALNRFGVQTSNPTEAIDVVGNIKVSSNLYTLNRVSLGLSNPTETLDILTNAKIRNNAYILNRLSIAGSNPSEALDVTGNGKVNGLFYVTSNIGIGNSNPSERLDVMNNSKFRNNVYVLNSLIVGANASNATETLDIRGNTKLSSNLYVLNNVGLGMSNPTERLDVLGNTKNSGNQYVMNRLGVGNSNPSERIEVTGNILAFGNTYATGNIGAGTVLPTEKIESSCNIKVQNNIYALSRISIGNSNPSETLDVNSNAKIGSNLYVGTLLGIGTSNPREDLDVRSNARVGNNLYILNRVGINTSNPIKPLHVIGDTRIEGDVGIIGNTRIEGNLEVTGAVAVIDTEVQVTEQFAVSNNGTGPALQVFQFGTNTIAEFYDDSNLAVTIADRGLVGIGTSNPLESLHISSGKIFTNIQYLASSNDTSNIPAYSFREDSNTGMFHAANDAIGFTTGGTEKVRIDNNGNVGIGTTTSAYKLDVNGDINFTGTFRQNGTPYVGSQWSNNSSNVFLMGSNVGVGRSNPSHTLDLYNPTVANINIESTSARTILWAYSDGKSYVQTSSDLFIGPLGTTTNPRMYLMSNGNIGVGTMTPSEKLHVVGKTFTTNQVLGYSGDTSNAPAFSWTDDSNTGIYHPSADALALVTGGVERLRVLSTGNVGIGVSNPSEALHVVGKTFTTNQVLGYSIDSSNTPAFSWTDDSNTGTYHPAADTMALVTGGVERLRVLSNGNVGIGTITPQSRLDVQGQLVLGNDLAWTTGGIRFRSLNGTQDAAIVQGSNGALIYRSGSNDGAGGHQWMNGGGISTLMTLTNAGNLGMGTTTPSALLHVNGTAILDGGSKIVVQNEQNGGTGRGIYLWGSNNTDWGIYTGESGATRALNGGTAIAGASFSQHAARFRTSNSSNNGFIFENSANQLLASIRGNDGLTYFAGNVGMGVTNPSYKLHVNGDMYSTGDIIAFSDKRLKSNIQPIINPLDKIKMLNGYTYMRDITEPTNKISQKYMGLIAQELENVVPEVISRDNDGFFSIAYGNLAGLFVEAIKELTARIETLENRQRLQ